VLNPHEHDVKPASFEAYEEHDASCECDFHREDFEGEDEIPVPSQAELERRYRYELQQKRSA
jgi:hypothetical protein